MEARRKCDPELGRLVNEHLDIDLVWLYEYSAYDSVDYIPADYAQTVYCNFGIYNSSDQTITLDFELSSPSEFIGDATCDEWYYINGDDGLCHTISDCGPNQYCNVNTMIQY